MGTTLGCKDVFELKESGNSRIILDKIKNGIWIFFRNSFTWNVFSKSYSVTFWNLGTRFREFPIMGGGPLEFSYPLGHAKKIPNTSVCKL